MESINSSFGLKPTICKSILIIGFLIASVGIVSADEFASSEFKIDDNFDYSEGDLIGVWSEDNPRVTENVSPENPLNPGERVEIGVSYSDGGMAEFGDEFKFYSTNNGEDYEKLDNYEFLNQHLEFEDGKYYFVTPSVEIGGSTGLQTGDQIEVKGKPPKLVDKGDTINTTKFTGEEGEINLRSIEEDSEDISSTVEVDRVSPQVSEISKVDSKTVRIEIEDKRAASLDESTFLNENGDLKQEIFSYEAIESQIGFDEPDAEFSYLEEESTENKAVFNLKLEKEFDLSRGVEVFLDGSIKDVAGNEITSLGSDKTVYGMNNQPPQIKADIEFNGETIGDSFDLTVYARSANDIEEISADVSSVNSKGALTESEGLSFNSCSYSDWNKCYTFEREDVEVEKGSDGSNSIQITASDGSRKNTIEKEISLTVIPQIAQEITVYDKNKPLGSIDSADVRFETPLDPESINKEHWKLIGENKVTAVSAELSDSSDKVLELEFGEGLDTTDANKVDVVHGSDTGDSEFLKTENGARVPSISAGRIIETDEAEPVPIGYSLQKNYNKGVLTFSEEISSAEYNGEGDYITDVTPVPSTDRAIVEFNTGVGSPDSGSETFSASDGTNSGTAEISIERNEFEGSGGFVALSEGWNVVALPQPGSVVGRMNGENIDGGLNSLSCVDQSYTRLGSWSNDVEDLSHSKGVYLNANQPCILEFNEETLEIEEYDIDAETLGSGWNLVSPYYGELFNSEQFGWIDYSNAGVSEMFSPGDSIEDKSCSNVEDCGSIGEEDVNVYDAYWAEN